MHIILTHEQADFDALASLLGAHLLDEASVPVLPRRVNRNVHAFLTLYGKELPFVDPRDLPSGPIERVTLVDTQSPFSIKGLTAQTRVEVIDHHPPREDLPEGWTLKADALGATTTLFVEAIHERGLMLLGVHATLMLLGIYEDTGSLTYTRTTPRDIRAAAYLLEEGASLEIVADFLRHPLSLEQQDLYDQLRSVVQTHQVHGHTVMVACGNAQDLQEEISTLAHKLRDLLEPDALFLLLTTRGGVQLVARSTSDEIDVGAVAAHFNGGGHERAAAALVSDGDTVGGRKIRAELDEVEEELLQILPALVRPAVTVAQIMSRGPQVIGPDTPVQEVARRMQRYGYEGYPVVEDGRVVGLLTRRAVDRALAHRLNLTAASLMQAGDVTARPEDSIEHLQSLMIDTGWGQIPVVNPETGEIIGIVTRTDLIKTLAPEPKVPGRLNLADRLEKALSPSRLALIHAVAREAHEQRAALYVVGGLVRDLLLDRPSLDLDLVVEGDAILLARTLAQRYGGRVTGHARFGTAKWHIGPVRAQLARTLAGRGAGRPSQQLKPETLPETLDLVSARTEFYTHPTALPTVERGSIKLDLHRRDFTINTLALRLDGVHYGQLHDYWGGLDDLQSGLVRVLHSLSFVDDPTRMLRAVRFEVRFDFEIEARTMELLQEARELIDRVSGDRVRNELNHIFFEPRAHAALERLDELGLLAAVHPALKGDAWLFERLQVLVEAAPESYWEVPEEIKGIPRLRVLGYTLWLLRLAAAQRAEAVRRLKLRRDLAEIVGDAGRLWSDLPALAGATPSRVVGRLKDLPPAAIYANYLAAEDEALGQLLQSFAARWKQITPRTTGDDLKAMGLPPGPAYREILEGLRTAWLDGQVTSPEEERAMLEEMVRRHQPHEA